MTDSDIIQALATAERDYPASGDVLRLQIVAARTGADLDRVRHIWQTRLISSGAG